VSNPSVTVVVPVLDDAEALDRCLRLLAAQTVAPLEVVVVDNGCRDRSAEVAVQHGARVVPEPVRGIPAAASRGYDAACGDLIARLDADSTPPPDWVERIVAVMRREPDLDAVTGSARFYDLPRWAAAVAGPVYLGCYYVLVHAALGHTPVWGSTMALRRGTWLEVRHLVHRDDPEVHDDMDLSFALGPRRRVRRDRRLVVGVPGRSLRGRHQLRRRLRRALHTLDVNWQQVPPWLRWQARWEARWAAPSERRREASPAARAPSS
jgi:glycosyltransferase involved in cell wall biosynthesis